MSDGPGPQQRFCGNCGAEVRSGTSFCFSCGTPLAAGAQEPPPARLEPSPSEEPSPFDKLMTWLRQASGRLEETLSGLSTDDLRRLPARAVGWFKGLSGVPKLVLVGLVVLVLLVLLSPVGVIIAALMVGVSIIALIIRAVQKRSLKNWGIVAVASVVLMFTFGGISDALYGGGGNSGGSGGGDNSASSGLGAAEVGDEVSFEAEPFGALERVYLDGRDYQGMTFDTRDGHVLVVTGARSRNFADVYVTLDILNIKTLNGSASASPLKVRIKGRYMGTMNTSGGGSYETVEAYHIAYK